MPILSSPMAGISETGRLSVHWAIVITALQAAVGTLPSPVDHLGPRFLLGALFHGLRFLALKWQGDWRAHCSSTERNWNWHVLQNIGERTQLCRFGFKSWHQITSPVFLDNILGFLGLNFPNYKVSFKMWIMQDWCEKLKYDACYCFLKVPRK